MSAHDPVASLLADVAAVRAAVQADDALLDAPPEDSDSRLVQALVAWRREVDAEPIGQLVDVDTALALMPRRGLLARLRAWLRGAR